MRGEKLFEVLELIGKAAKDMGELIGALPWSKWHVLYPSTRISRVKAKMQFEEHERIRFQKMFSRLKKEGLVVGKEGHDGFLYYLTECGMQKLEKLKNRFAKGFLPVPQYTKEKSAVFTIIVFDIPERDRRQRDWLRSVLENLGFTMLQKSVWIGKIKIPAQFLEDLHRLDIVRFVEILEITKAGTLHNLAG